MPFCRFTLRGPKPLPVGYPKELRSIGDHLRKRRLDLGLTQAKAAALMGAHVTTLRGWERNATSPALRFMPAIVRFLGYAPEAEPNSLPDQMKFMRRHSGLSQLRLADLLGVDEGTIRRWERGRTKPSSTFSPRLQDLIRDLRSGRVKRG